MVKIDLFSGGIREKIPIILIMTLYTRQPVIPFSMINDNISMGKKDSIFDQYFLVSMANAAAVPGYGILSGKYSKRSSLPGFFGPYRFNRLLMGRLYFHGVKWLNCVMDAIHDPIAGSHSGLS